MIMAPTASGRIWVRSSLPYDGAAERVERLRHTHTFDGANAEHVYWATAGGLDPDRGGKGTAVQPLSPNPVIEVSRISQDGRHTAGSSSLQAASLRDP